LPKGCVSILQCADDIILFTSWKNLPLVHFLPTVGAPSEVWYYIWLLLEVLCMYFTISELSTHALCNCKGFLIKIICTTKSEINMDGNI
jgi:hypothetical protein